MGVGPNVGEGQAQAVHRYLDRVVGEEHRVLTHRDRGSAVGDDSDAAARSKLNELFLEHLRR